jgi:hypothetical protein
VSEGEVGIIVGGGYLVYEAIKRINSKRSIALFIKNDTDETFKLVGDHNAHGRFAVDPPPVIEPHTEVAFGVVSKDSSVGTGCEGWAKYEREGSPLVLQVDWDNPFAGSNSGSAEVTGESPTRFRATADIGGGNNSTNHYHCYLSPWWRYAGCGKDIGVGANGAVWLIGCSQTAGGYVIRRWDKDASAWVPVDGGGRRIAVGPDGTPWLVNSDQKIYRGQPDGGDWEPIAGSGNDIAVGGDGSVWLIGSSSTSGGYVIRRRQTYDSGWEKVGGGGRRIAVGPDGTPWLVNTQGSIYRGQNVGGVWDWGKPLPGCGKDIAVGADGTVWVVGCDKVSGGYSLHKWIGTPPDSPWERQAGGGTDISVAPDGRPWIVNSAGSIYSLDGLTP